jgi:hypothetical protein
MKRTIRVIETYVPGLNERPAFWCETLLKSVSAALSPKGTEIAVLAIPNDETLMWMARGGPDSSDQESAIAAVVLRETATAGGAVEIERVVDGLVVWGQSDGGGTS